MFTVSCYAFHPLVLQFVRIWRYTQVVSEVLTCILSMLCCQCMNMMLLSNRSSNESQFSVQRFKDGFYLPFASLLFPYQCHHNALCEAHNDGVLLADYGHGGQSHTETSQLRRRYYNAQDDFVNHTNFGMAKEEGESLRTQYMVVEVQPEQKIASKVQMRCGEGWQLGKSDQELQDKMEFPVQKHICSTRDLQTATSFWTHHLGDNIPGIHSTRKGVVKPSSNLYIK